MVDTYNVKEWIEERAKLEARVVELENRALEYRAEIGGFEKANRELGIRVEELEKDKARLDWLDSMEETNVYNSEGFICCMWRRGYENFDGESIRAAIDAAKEE